MTLRAEDRLAELYDRVYEPNEYGLIDYGDEPWVTLADEAIRCLPAMVAVVRAARLMAQWADNIVEWRLGPVVNAELVALGATVRDLDRLLVKESVDE